jgi:general secretion pathway protein J
LWERGFTLLEVLVGLVVLGMLMVGLAQGLQYGFRVWDSQASFIAQRDRLDAVDRALRQLIGQIDTRDQETPALFVGSANHFDFTTELPTALSFVSRRADASLLVDEHRLILRWTPHLHATRLKDPPRPTDTELLSGVERVEFRYWKAADTGGIPAGWLSDWNDPQPPELVKIHLVFAPGDPRHWPDIIAARQLDMSTP